MIPKLAPDNLLARTIDDVIRQLEGIIARSIREKSRLGFFAALYHKVTIRVREGIAAGQFEQITWDEALATNENNMPDLLDMNAPLSLPPVPIPGKCKWGDFKPQSRA